MQQFFAFGSSTVYGVGSSEGSYIDMLKKYLHTTSFSDGGSGEGYEVFNFGFAGATTEKVADLYQIVVKNFGRNCHKTCIVNVGGNNMKAEDSEENFVSTPEQFEKNLYDFLKLLKDDFDEIIFVGGSYVDESKTTPKKNPLKPTSPGSRFRNDRNSVFNAIQEKVSESLGITFIGIDLTPDKRVEEYGYIDGLHNNTKGHQYYFEKILKVLKEKGLVH